MARRTLISSLAALALLAAALIGMTAAPTLAASINYGDKPALSVTYTQVTEDSLTDAVPKFGAPNITGDSMDFDPIGFGATATGAGGNDLIDVQLKFGIVAKPGKVLENISITEAGDTTLSGFGNFTTFTSVTTNVFIEIEEVDGVALPAELNLAKLLAFTPSGGTYDLQNDGGGGPLFNASWLGSLTVNLDAELALAGIPFVNGVTKVQVTLDNTLTALSQSGTTAFIAKKDADGVTITSNVPEPASCLMALLGLAGLGLRRR